MIPLYGFVPGDTCGVLVLVDSHATVATLGALLAEAASIRVTPGKAPAILWEGRMLDPTMTVADAGLSALDRVDLVAGVR